MSHHTIFMIGIALAGCNPLGLAREQIAHPRTPAFAAEPTEVLPAKTGPEPAASALPATPPPPPPAAPEEAPSAIASPASEVPARDSAAKTYRLRRGDTITAVARRTRLRTDRLLAANSLTRDDHPREGEEIALTEAAPTEWTVRRGQTLSEIAGVLGVSTAALTNANGLADPSAIRAGDVLVVPDGAR